jgi:hypothetical protein
MLITPMRRSTCVCLADTSHETQRHQDRNVKA